MAFTIYSPFVLDSWASSTFKVRCGPFLIASHLGVKCFLFLSGKKKQNNRVVQFINKSWIIIVLDEDAGLELMDTTSSCVSSLELLFQTFTCCLLVGFSTFGFVFSKWKAALSVQRIGRQADFLFLLHLVRTFMRASRLWTWWSVYHLQPVLESPPWLWRILSSSTSSSLVLQTYNVFALFSKTLFVTVSDRFILFCQPMTFNCTDTSLDLLHTHKYTPVYGTSSNKDWDIQNHQSSSWWR